MKKITALLLSLIMLMSLCACGSGTASPAAPAKPGSASGETAPAKPGSAPEAAQAPDVLRPIGLLITESTRSDWDRDTYVTYLNQTWFELSLSEKDSAAFPALAAALREWSADARSGADATYETLSNDSRQFYEENPAYGGDYSDELTAVGIRADSVVTSVRGDWTTYTGGAHGYYSSAGFNWDSKTGELLSSAEVFTDKNTLIDVLKEKLFAQYANYIEEDWVEDYFNFIRNGEADFNFNLTCIGAVFYFNPYQIASYAAGMQIIEITWDEYPQLFNSKYTEAPDSWIREIGGYGGIIFDITGDGVQEFITILSECDDEYGYWHKYGISVDGAQLWPEQCSGYSVDSYLVKCGGKYYMYLFTTSDNDYVSLNVVDCSRYICGAAVSNLYPAYSYFQEDGDIWGKTRAAFVNPESMVMGSRVHALGSYTGLRTYTPDANGTPVTYDEYSVTSTTALTVLKTFGGTLLNADGFSGGRYEIPAGSVITVAGTDTASYVTVKLSDGTLVKCDYKPNEWPRIIDGKDENDLFEMLPYAG